MMGMGFAAAAFLCELFQHPIFDLEDYSFLLSCLGEDVCIVD